MHRELAAQLTLLGVQLDRALRDWLPLSDATMEVEEVRQAAAFNAAMEDAVFPGGKRMRPLLALLAGGGLHCPASSLLPTAVAIEFLHCSSLVFDDLPCMDDAQERRGRPALHRRHGEGIAILVGLALFNRAWELFARAAAAAAEPRLLEEVGQCLGASGMIGGQAFDLMRAPAGRTKAQAHFLKTTALTRLMLSAPAIVAGAPAAVTAALGSFGAEFGLVYQQLDDLIDLDEDALQTVRHGAMPTSMPESPAAICAALDQRMRDAQAAVAALPVGPALAPLCALVQLLCEDLMGRVQARLRAA